MMYIEDHTGKYSKPIKPKCFTGHKVIDLRLGVKLYGGSCLHPVVTDADIYIGLEKGMVHPKKATPWNGGHVIQFYIPNMGVPKNKGEFKKLVNWLATQLVNGSAVHVGCIGGHGRTGMVLSAVYYVLQEDKYAISYMREHYCNKSVESAEQIDFLNNLYGIEKVTPIYSTKDLMATPDTGSFQKFGNSGYSQNWESENVTGHEAILHVPVKGNIWN